MVSETGAVLKKDCASGYRGPDLKLYVRDVRDPTGKKRAFFVKSWGTVKDAKEAIQKCITQVPVHAQRLYFGSPLLSSGKELPNYRTLHDAGIYRSGETLLLDIGSSDDASSTFWGSSSSFQRIQSSSELRVSSSLINSTPRVLHQTVQDARRAFAIGIKPDLVMDGSGGCYYLHDVKKNRIAVFKPADEEPYAVNNPRGYVPQQSKHGQVEGLRQGIEPGEACIREVAAFLLDHDGFAGVPMTTLAEARHPAFNNNGARLKVSEGGASIGAHSLGSSSDLAGLSSGGVPKKVGSFQEYVRCECSMDDISPSKISVDQVHKIAILDIRLMNADRNPANLLCRRLYDNSLELVPIDHGYCLRSSCDVSWMDWCWLDWPQLKQPLSPKSRAYIQRLDVEADARMLRERLNISEDAIDYIRASTALLKAGVEAGLSLYDISILCCRNDNMGETPSHLEHLTDMASELAKVAVQNEDWHHATASRAIEEQLTPTRSTTASNGVKSRDRSSYRFHRCASSGEFLISSEDSKSAVDDSEQPIKSNLSRALEQHHENQPALSALSSGSDSSGESNEDCKDEGRDEIEQWAHNIIEDSFQTFPPTASRGRGRQCSIDESSSFGTSPKGFWHVRPGSVDDNASLSSSFGDSCSSFGTSPPQSFSEFVLPVPQGLQQNRKVSVTFLTPEDDDDIDASVQPRNSSLKHHDSLRSSETPPILQRLESGTSIPRSKSYSALSRRFSSSNLSCVPSTTSKVNNLSASMSHHIDKTEDFEYYRTYFIKFIDLVIAREMARHQHVHA